MSMEDYDTLIWKIIDTYFKSEPRRLVKHHIDSYNLFFLYILINKINLISFHRK